MSITADFELKERVRAAIDIVDLMGSTLELRRQGRGYVARCPWHDDRRPSLQINAERQTWRCWVCDIGGDAFSYVMRRDGVSFPEAMRTLAERAGIVIENEGPKRADGIDKASLLKVMSWATDQFRACLVDSADAAEARQYLIERGITPESQALFQLGFAPDTWQWLIDRANQDGYSHKLLEAAGLVLSRSSGTGFYDRFRGRLMFPIFDLQNRPIAFGGRILPSAASKENAGAKYINSPETLLFSKSRQLYGLNIARDPIRKENNVLVMEGYTDVILSHQFGAHNSVAVLGTALGEAHIQMLRRFVDRVTLVLDGDAAGQRRADEVLELFVAADVDLRIMTLPDELDPAEFFLERGTEAFHQLVKESPDAIDHKLQRLTAGIDLMQETHKATAAIETLLSLVARAPQGGVADLRCEQLLLRFSRTFGLPIEGLRQRFAQLRQKLLGQAARNERKERITRVDGGAPTNEVPEATKVSPRTERLLGADREVFEILIEAPHLVPDALEKIDPSFLYGDTARLLLDAYQRLEVDGHDLDLNSLLLVVDEPHLKSTLVELDQRVRDRCERVQQLPVEDRWVMIARRFQSVDLSRTADRQLAHLESNQLEAEEELEILQQLLEAQRARHGLMGRPK